MMHKKVRTEGAHCVLLESRNLGKQSSHFSRCVVPNESRMPQWSLGSLNNLTCTRTFKPGVITNTLLCGHFAAGSMNLRSLPHSRIFVVLPSHVCCERSLGIVLNYFYLLTVAMQNGTVFLQWEQCNSVSTRSVLQKGQGVDGSSASSISPNLFLLGGFLTTASIFFWYLTST